MIELVVFFPTNICLLIFDQSLTNYRFYKIVGEEQDSPNKTHFNSHVAESSNWPWRLWRRFRPPWRRYQRAVFTIITNNSFCSTFGKKRHRQCTENVRYSPPKKRVALPTNLQQISQMKNAITKRLQGNDIDANLSLRIVKASLERQETHLRYNHKIGKKANKGAKPPRVIIK